MLKLALSTHMRHYWLASKPKYLAVGRIYKDKLITRTCCMAALAIGGSFQVASMGTVRTDWFCHLLNLSIEKSRKLVHEVAPMICRLVAVT